MKRTLITTGIIVILMATAAVAQCDCVQATNSTLACYEAFWVGDPISFRLAVPAEYFFSCSTCVTPLITGWRVETASGSVVTHTVFCDAPVGHWLRMTWNQEGASYEQVMPGYYRLVIETTSAGEIDTFLRIVSQPCCCGMTPRLCSIPCIHDPADPYIELIRPNGGSACCGSLSIPHYPYTASP